MNIDVKTLPGTVFTKIPTISHMALNEEVREYLEKHSLKQEKYYFQDDGLKFHLYLKKNLKLSVKLNSL